MEDNLATSYGLPYSQAVAQLARNQFDHRRKLRRQQAQQTRVAAGVVAHEGPHLRPFVEQALHEVASNEATGTGDEHFAAFPELTHRFGFS